MKKDPSVIEREEMEKISKYWVNIARKEIPKHHRIFANFHRKQITDAKRVSETCQREVCATATYVLSSFQIYAMVDFSILIFLQVKMKVSRSLKVMRGAGMRTRKLARDMLVFWKRVDKEMVLSYSDYYLKLEQKATFLNERLCHVNYHFTIYESFPKT